MVTIGIFIHTVDASLAAAYIDITSIIWSSVILELGSVKLLQWPYNKTPMLPKREY